MSLFQEGSSTGLTAGTAGRTPEFCWIFRMTCLTEKPGLCIRRCVHSLSSACLRTGFWSWKDFSGRSRGNIKDREHTGRFWHTAISRSCLRSFAAAAVRRSPGFRNRTALYMKSRPISGRIMDRTSLCRRLPEAFPSAKAIFPENSRQSRESASIGTSPMCGCQMRKSFWGGAGCRWPGRR